MNELFPQPGFLPNTGQQQIKVGQVQILHIFTVANLFRDNDVKDQAHSLASAGTYQFIIVERPRLLIFCLERDATHKLTDVISG
jgi:hypothetical protein